MKAALVSDTHGYLPEIPPAVDFIIHAGDLSYGIGGSNESWYAKDLRLWMEGHGKEMHAGFGNHDAYEHVRYPRPESVKIHIDEMVEIYGMRCYFTPWSLRYYSWSFMGTEEELMEKWQKIPDSTQILISHSPPYTKCDRNSKGDHCGSVSLLMRIRELRDLRLVVCGHIHEGYGWSQDKGVDIYNVSLMNGKQQPTHAPVVIDWPVVS